jgi:hypothetical protein
MMTKRIRTVIRSVSGKTRSNRLVSGPISPRKSRRITFYSSFLVPMLLTGRVGKESVADLAEGRSGIVAVLRDEPLVAEPGGCGRVDRSVHVRVSTSQVRWCGSPSPDPTSRPDRRPELQKLEPAARKTFDSSETNLVRVRNFVRAMMHLLRSRTVNVVGLRPSRGKPSSDPVEHVPRDTDRRDRGWSGSRFQWQIIAFMFERSSQPRRPPHCFKNRDPLA